MGFSCKFSLKPIQWCLYMDVSFFSGKMKIINMLLGDFPGPVWLPAADMNRYLCCGTQRKGYDGTIEPVFFLRMGPNNGTHLSSRWRLRSYKPWVFTSFSAGRRRHTDTVPKFTVHETARWFWTSTAPWCLHAQRRQHLVTLAKWDFYESYAELWRLIMTYPAW